MKKLKEIIDGHKFFCRKSQHYIMGNWNEYEEWVNQHPQKPFWNKEKWRYTIGFIPAYLRFMYLTIFNK